MRETVCVKTICGIINKNSVYSQTGHIDCNVHDRHLNKRSKCRMTSTIMTRNGEISSAWWTREGVSVQFSSLHLVVSDSLQPHGLQHARPPCPSPTLRVYSNSCPLSQWCHLTISSSVIPFSSCLQSFPASGSFPMSSFFTSGGQSIGVSPSTPVLPMNQFSSVQSLSHVWLFAIPWTTACQASLSITNSWSSLKLTSIESVMPSNHLILCRPLFLLLPIPPSITVFSNESTLHMRWQNIQD